MRLASDSQHGFTIIELMVVLAIVSILAVIAMPVYQGYAGRAKVSEAINAAGGIQTQLAEYYNNNGFFPTGEQFAGAGNEQLFAGAYTQSITLTEQCTLEMVLDLPGVAGGKPKLVSKPWYDSGAYTLTYFTPGNNGLPNNYIPSSTRSYLVEKESDPPSDSFNARHCCGAADNCVGGSG